MEGFRESFVRLSAALLQTTVAQTEMGIESDLTLLREWAHKFHVFASQKALTFVKAFAVYQFTFCFANSSGKNFCWKHALSAGGA